MQRWKLNVQKGDYSFLENHQLSSKANKVVGDFFPKYVGLYRVVDVKNNIIIIKKDGKTVPVNMDQERVYKF